MKVQNDQGGNGGRRPPGNGGSPSHYFVPEPAGFEKERPTSSTPSQMGVAADASLPWLKNLWEFGKQRPILRGSYRWIPEDVASLIDKAVAEAKANAPLPWDPVHNAHDAQMVREREKLDKEEPQAKQKYQDDLASQEEVEIEHANFYRNAAKPSRPILAIILTTLFLALSLAPAFFDGFFFRVDDERLAWLMASGLGIIGSGCICYLIVGE